MGIGRSAALRPVGRVAPADADASVADDQRREDGPASRALALVEPAADRAGADFGPRFAAAAPFLTQLIVDRDGGPLAGERRRQRANGLVGTRASAAYGATERLATRIEPGFLLRRSV